MTESIAEETLDSILGGALRLYQPRRGYRFSVEAVLLARFAAARPAARVLELGAGCGVVALIYAALARPREVVALEIQPALAALIARNAALNDLGIVRAVCADLRSRRALDAARRLRPGARQPALSRPLKRARKSARRAAVSPAARRRLGWRTSQPPRRAMRATAAARPSSSRRRVAPSSSRRCAPAAWSPSASASSIPTPPRAPRPCWSRRARAAASKSKSSRRW